ncbi:MAG: hypothetical protein MUC42_18010, partial [Bryobacter sp.]|nr:hypothetical protein [Bryobacter sp.]
MNKSYRHGQILKLIRAKRITTQEDLARQLHSLGVEATPSRAIERAYETAGGVLVMTVWHDQI